MKKVLLFVGLVAVFLAVLSFFYQKYTVQEIQNLVGFYNGTANDNSLIFLDNSTDGHIIKHGFHVAEGNMVFTDESQSNLEYEKTLELINILKTDGLERRKPDPEGMHSVKFCTFIPTYSLVFNTPSGTASFTMCFNCNEVYEQFEEDGETRKSDTYDFSEELEEKLKVFFEGLEWE